MIDVAIVGGGPAGLTAALYLRRFHRSCVVFDTGESRARWIPESNNCPGFPGGVGGRELLQRLRRQAGSVQVPFEPLRVDRIAAADEGFDVDAGGRRWQARMVMIATGLRDRLPGPWGEEALACGALRLCPICDAFEASDAHIGVYGHSRDIGSHAGFLRAFSRRVSALPYDGGDGGEDGAAARAAGVRWLGAGELEFDGERCRYRGDGETLEPDTVYSFLGFTTSVPTDGLDLRRTDGGEILVDRHQQTRTPELYAIGDVVGGLNQIAVAVGQAAAAATHAHGQLPELARGGAGGP
ncbi:NAD(P)/FAD-dependent oxidoreductase [Luteimonas wenzhouensis]|uniref:NAD(P)/FAD-dependent oxidoreductase n=1 Tax=Luteimonas wenzhouensis TaxID=2599615 RepID=A0A5C5U1S6_9GAMM|nr:NAD(P)/FAD-dependent oxidoreductase [Luteimonas wenzhouensis]TWT19678.1 NAD(P)/FAD-dependent oxidoreductase [Luteimonas wenzhouensis]